MLQLKHNSISLVNHIDFIVPFVAIVNLVLFCCILVHIRVLVPVCRVSILKATS